MRLVWAPAGFGNNVRGTTQRSCHITPFQHDAVLSFCGAHLFVEALVAGQCGPDIPHHFQLLRGPYGVPFLVRDDPDEIATPHDTRAGDIADRCLIDTRNFRAGAIGALTPRPDHTRVHHARQSHVLCVDVFAADLIGNVLARNSRAHQFVVGWRFHGRRTSEGNREEFATDQFAVGYRAARTLADRDHTLRYAQTLHWCF